jgi:hypothetical protein
VPEPPGLVDRQLDHALGAGREPDLAHDRAIAAPRLDEAEAAWFDATTQVMQDLAIVPVIEKKTSWMRSSRVRNCTWTIMGSQCDLTTVWLSDAAAARSEHRP